MEGETRVDLARLGTKSGSDEAGEVPKELS
jgi:hypothetical protein